MLSNPTEQQAHGHNPVSHYLTIWFSVVVLFGISVAVAQVSESRPLVLVVAFGIAIIQIYLVAAYFMHLKGEKTYISYLLISMLLALSMLYWGTSDDVERTSGLFWKASDTIQIINAHKNQTVHHSHE
jgi:caa(3)-type oxidase subunit IV